MDILDGSGFWFCTDGSFVPPPPTPAPDRSGGGGHITDAPTQVRWRPEVIAELERRRIIADDDEWLVIEGA